MTSFLPILPLPIVVYPQEVLSLSIKEPSDKQLVYDSRAQLKPFGIVYTTTDSMSSMGTSVEILTMNKEEEGGTLEISIRGMEVFNLLETIKDLPDKLYTGAIVHFPENVLENSASSIAELIADEVNNLFCLLKGETQLPNQKRYTSYEIAHQAGLSKNQEYEILGLLQEVHRLEYLRRHLKGRRHLMQQWNDRKNSAQHLTDFNNPNLN